MTDVCRIFRGDGTQVTDPATGVVTGGTVTVYAGKCELRPNNVGRQVQTGQTAATQSSLLLKVPISVVGVEAGHLVEVTVSADPDLQGSTLRVEDPHMGTGTHTTARRIGCEVYSRG
jgi:hypothetical protein